ncbi:uncharacterized protein LOC128243939 [Mya arenaria]|uniref:uncharacterized protein LOC128243939 n=1 Tax=Mya arenaria TaxID=6604 RepID=UPI0022E371AB|nr:uncharacterized protein LOC128243939 [Mya arenaria]
MMNWYKYSRFDSKSDTISWYFDQLKRTVESETKWVAKTAGKEPSSFHSFRGGLGGVSLAEGRFVQGGTITFFNCGSEGYFASGCAADLQGTTFMGIGRGRGVTIPVAATASPRTQLFVPANGGQ